MSHRQPPVGGYQMQAVGGEHIGTWAVCELLSATLANWGALGTAHCSANATCRWSPAYRQSGEDFASHQHERPYVL